MDRILNVDIYPRNSDLESAYAEFSLPAYPYELRCAMREARVDEHTEIDFAVYNYGRAAFLAGNFEHIKDARMLRGMNALMMKVAEMSDWELAAFEGLVLMEASDEEIMLPLERLYNLAASVSDCHVLFDVTDDEQLGRFFADNGFMPELDRLSEEELSRLDYRKIGREKRKENGGVFLEEMTGYVEWDGDITEAWQSVNLDPMQPDYAVLMELRRTDAQDIPPVILKLPAVPGTLQSAMQELRVGDWSSVSMRCLDCKVPAVGKMLASLGSPADISQASVLLAGLTDDQAILCEALLEAVPCADLSEAADMLQSVEQYTLTPELSTPAEYAKADLLAMLGEETANLLIPCVGLDVYGEHLLSKGTAAMTKYGALRRKDGLPLRAPLEQARSVEERTSAETIQTDSQEHDAPEDSGKRAARKRGRRAAER